MGATIGFVEDDDVIRENYSDLLREEGYQVLTAESSSSARELFARNSVDLMILDISLGSETDAGYVLCSMFRQQNRQLPIIFLTSHDTELDHASGLRVGADDYLSKGTSFALLLVRIQTLLRRVNELSRHRESVSDQTLIIDSDSLSISWSGCRVEMPLTQYWIVSELVESRAVCTPERLMRAANITVEPNTIAAHIKNIRARFRSIDQTFNCIRTERGRGYRWLD